MAIEGERLIDSALISGFWPKFVLHHPDYSGQLLTVLNDAAIQCLSVSPSLFAQLSTVETPPGLIAVLPRPQLPLPESIQKALILDAVREPGNIGTIIRTALGAGIDAVYFAPECVDPYNPKAVRAAAGAHFRIPLCRLSWKAIAKEIEQMSVFLADSTAEMDYTSINWRHSPWALIVSNEAHGPSKAALNLASQRLRIPLANELDSLNVAVATAVILFEAHRQAGG